MILAGKHDQPATSTMTPSPVVQAATDLMTVLWAAEYRGLPLPFTVRAYEQTGPGQVCVQFHTIAEVDVWAEAMGADVTDGVARGELLDVAVEACAYVAEVAA